MIYQKEILLPQYGRGFHLITDIILKELEFMPEMGIINIFLQHTSAALCLNENADPDVRKDFESFLNYLIPESYKGFVHTSEGPDDMPAHIKSSLFGQSLNIPVSGKRIKLGTWQGIYLCEFRNFSQRRKMLISVFY
jgi:secondary thiamine-phosphate synthase enzyme